MTNLYAHNITISILNKSLENGDYATLENTVKSYLPIINQSYNMFSLLKSLKGKFDDNENNYNYEIENILSKINEELEKITNQKELEND